MNSMPKYRTVTCASCEVLVINNVICHELGCPNAWKDETRECKCVGAVSNRKRETKSSAIPNVEKPITANKRKEFNMAKPEPVAGQCGTCKFAAAYVDSLSEDMDWVHCSSVTHAKMLDDQSGCEHYMQELKEYRFLNLWRLESIDEVSFKCPDWQPLNSP